MSDRVRKINEQLLSEIALLVNRELVSSNFLATITRVDCTNDLKQARVGISVLPENKTGSALKAVRSLNSLIRKELSKKLKLKFIPKFDYIYDDTEKNAAVIEDILDQIKHEND